MDSRLEIRLSTGKGRGIFAKVAIPAGTRILTEKALLEIFEDVTSTPDNVYAAYKALQSD
jgi:SET domain-containing protein